MKEGCGSLDKYVPTRTDAFSLLLKYTKSEYLIKHALAVEAVMRHFAEYFGEDVEKWGIVGLVHDLDYECYPDQHCKKANEILSEYNWPQEYIRAIVSHGWKICSDVEPRGRMEKVLYTIDELTGLISATALMRPSKSVLDLTVKSVKKKWKQSSFAAGVNRAVIEEGANMLGMSLEEVMEETILAMRKVADEIDLHGSVA